MGLYLTLDPELHQFAVARPQCHRSHLRLLGTQLGSGRGESQTKYWQKKFRNIPIFATLEILSTLGGEVQKNSNLGNDVNISRRVSEQLECLQSRDPLKPVQPAK